MKVVIRIIVNLEDLLSSRKSSFQLLLCNYAKKKKKKIQIMNIIRGNI